MQAGDFVLAIKRQVAQGRLHHVNPGPANCLLTLRSTGDHDYFVGVAGILVHNAVNCFFAGVTPQEAEGFAPQRGLQTVGMTPEGQAMATLTNGMSEAESDAYWTPLSANAAANASGDVYVLQGPQVELNSIFGNTEYDILLNNPNVTNIFFYMLMGDGSVVGVP